MFAKNRTAHRGRMEGVPAICRSHIMDSKLCYGSCHLISIFFMTMHENCQPHSRNEKREPGAVKWLVRSKSWGSGGLPGSVPSLHKVGEALRWANQVKTVRTQWTDLQRDPKDMATWISHFCYSWKSMVWWIKEVGGAEKVRKLTTKDEKECAIHFLGWVCTERPSPSWRWILASWLACFIDKCRKNHFVLCSLLINQVNYQAAGFGCEWAEGQCEINRLALKNTGGTRKNRETGKKW